MGLAIKVNKASGTQVYVDESLYGGNRLDITNCELPYRFVEGDMLVYNNEIHLLGGYGAATNHYKYNGKTWEQVSILPFQLSGTINAVVHNGAIYYVRFAKMYKWDGVSWEQLDDAPFNASMGSLVSYNNELHFLRHDTVNKEHYKWDGSSWSLVSTLPYQDSTACVLVYNNEIHMMGGNTQDVNRSHYKWDGTSWTKLENLSRTTRYGNAVVYNDKIYYFTTNEGSLNEYYSWDGTESSYEGVSKITVYKGCLTVFNNNIYIAGGYGAPFMLYQLGKQLVSIEQVV